jgi:hypothetical protein
MKLSATFFQRGFHWCLTRFVFNSQGLNEEEIRNTKEDKNTGNNKFF